MFWKAVDVRLSDFKSIGDRPTRGKWEEEFTTFPSGGGVLVIPGGIKSTLPMVYGTVQILDQEGTISADPDLRKEGDSMTLITMRTNIESHEKRRKDDLLNDTKVACQKPS